MSFSKLFLGKKRAKPRDPVDADGGKPDATPTFLPTRFMQAHLDMCRATNTNILNFTFNHYASQPSTPAADLWIPDS
jgi:hypothetical protein